MDRRKFLPKYDHTKEDCLCFECQVSWSNPNVSRKQKILDVLFALILWSGVAILIWVAP